MKNTSLVRSGLFFCGLVWLAGCGQPICVGGFGHCDQFGPHDKNPNTNGIALTLNPGAIRYSERQMVTATPGGGTAPYYFTGWFVDPAHPDATTATIASTQFSPAYLDPRTSGVLYSTFTAPEGPPDPAYKQQDRVGYFYDAAIQVKDSTGKSHVSVLRVYE